MDLGEFYGVYRENGQGRAAYEPSMMVALLLYSYARGNRSSRGIERACREDVTYKVITAMRVPDHSTIAEFRRRHERALGELFFLTRSGPKHHAERDRHLPSVSGASAFRRGCRAKVCRPAGL